VGPYLRPAPGASKSGSALLDSAARQNDDAGAKSDDSANDGRREAELDEANGAVGAWTMRPMTSPTTAPTMPTEAAPTTAHRPGSGRSPSHVALVFIAYFRRPLRPGVAWLRTPSRWQHGIPVSRPLRSVEWNRGT